MTPDEHIAAITADFKQAATAKYFLGVAEHGEGLRQLPSLTLLDEAIKETIDQYVFLYTLREQLEANHGADI